MLYAIHVGDDGSVNAGPPPARYVHLRVLQTAQHSRPHPCAAWPVTPETSTRFASRALCLAGLRGEWLACTPALRTFGGERAETMPARRRGSLVLTGNTAG